jgi:hypothetical protein
MGFYTGRTGSIQVDAKTVLKIRDWSLEATVELLSTNSIDSFANSFVPGVKGATGSATIMYYRKESGDGADTRDFSTVLRNAGMISTGKIDTGNRVAFILNASNQNQDDIKFDGYITSAGVTVSTGEISTIAINFTVDGDFTQVFDVT